MGKFKESRLNLYFPTDIIEYLENYVKGKEFKVTIVNKHFSKDLFSICSMRDLCLLDEDNSIIKSTRDVLVDVIYGDVILGKISTHLKINNGVNEVIKSIKTNHIIGEDSLLIAKHTETSDKSFLNIYAIV